MEPQWCKLLHLVITSQSLAAALCTQDLQTWNNLYGRHLNEQGEKGLFTSFSFFFFYCSHFFLPWKNTRNLLLMPYGVPLNHFSFDSLHSFTAVADLCGWVGHWAGRVQAKDKLVKAFNSAAFPCRIALKSRVSVLGLTPVKFPTALKILLWDLKPLPELG